MKVWLIRGISLYDDIADGGWIQEIRHDSRENADLRAQFHHDEAVRRGNTDYRFQVEERDSLP